MKRKKAEQFYLGLDVGTSSIGSVITTRGYRIPSFKGKSLWSVRKFTEALTSKDRRTKRAARRALNRKKFRIDLLQKIFQDAINEVDDGFYLRLKESHYVPEDKLGINGEKAKTADSLFADPDYTDKDYFKDFPTIHHLIQYLKETDETPDIRLVYLAIAYMMGHRGHFLFAGELKAVQDLGTPLEKLLSELECMDFHLTINKEKTDKIGKILRDKNLTKSVKKKELISLLGAKTNCEKAILTLITGGKVNLSKIFDDKNLDNIAKNGICFSESKYDENEDKLKDGLQDMFAVIEQAKSVYDWSILANILDGYSSISEAKIAVYDKHHSDLNYLRKLIRKNLGKNVYWLVFMKSKKGLHNYVAYSGHGYKCRHVYKCTAEEFYQFLKKEVINKINDKEKTKYIEEEIEKGTFLPKQVTRENSALPHQVYLEELNAIICNLSDRIDVLAQNADAIRDIFSFCVPYYVGPLNGVVKKNGERTDWAQRKSNKAVTPMNFNDVIDLQMCQELFIRRMTNKCTYIHGADVLPRYSLLYCKFTVLNELNTIKVNGEPLSVELKKKIYEDLFLQYRNVTEKRLIDYLAQEGYPDAEISGIDVKGGIKSSLSSYHDFKEMGCNLTDEEIEDIIFNVTLFGQNKEVLRERLVDHGYKDTDKLCALSYKGWGTLSKELLTDVTTTDPETGRDANIIAMLWDTNNNLSQVLSSKYQFLEKIEKENRKYIPDEITFDYIDELHISAPVKRQIWQAVKTAKEYKRILNGNLLHGEIVKIFLEMARGKTNDGQKESRKATLIQKYKEGNLDRGSDNERDWINEIKDTEINAFKQDKLFLYYLQQGRCAYSGEEIPLAELFDAKYDIEHIWPQSKIKDDSLDNRVLVKKTLNATKSNEYPIDREWQEKMRPFWKSLVDNGFISKDKYSRLVRTTPLSAEELGGFIARQLVETRQSTKILASILQQMFPDAEIVYVKAGPIADFRHDNNFIKVRDMNDLHHAKDAYLAIVVGNVYDTKFTKNPVRFMKDNPGYAYNLNKLFDKDVVKRNGEKVWIAGEKGMIKTVRETMHKNDITVTEQLYETHGKFSDENTLKKGNGQMPIKSKDARLQDIDKYGGYGTVFGAYFMLVESENKKGETYRSIEFIPVYMSDKCKTEEEKLQYLTTRNINPLTNPRILVPVIKPGTQIKINGFPLRIVSRSENQIAYKCDVQLILPDKEALTLKHLMQFLGSRKKNKEVTLPRNLTEEDLIDLYDAFLDKLDNSIYRLRPNNQSKLLHESRDKFLKLTPENKCKVLAQISWIFKAQDTTPCDLSLIGGSKNAGKISLTKRIDKYNDVIMTTQSTTGAFTHEIDLKTVGRKGNIVKVPYSAKCQCKKRHTA